MSDQMSDQMKYNDFYNKLASYHDSSLIAKSLTPEGDHHIFKLWDDLEITYERHPGVHGPRTPHTLLNFLPIILTTLLDKSKFPIHGTNFSYAIVTREQAIELREMVIELQEIVINEQDEGPLLK